MHSAAPRTRTPGGSEQDVTHHSATFDEIVGFYLAAGFLYPAKLAELGDRLDLIKDTWRRLVEADRVFEMMLLRRTVAGEPAVKNSVCTFQTLPGIWHVQHLVSADRHERAGTLAILLAISDLMEARPDAAGYKLTYRPDNRGAAQLFGGLIEALPDQRSHAALTGDRVVGTSSGAPLVAPARADSGMVVRPASRRDVRRLADLYARAHPALPGWMALDDLPLARLDRVYRAHGLSRRRHVLVAESQGRITRPATCTSRPTCPTTPAPRSPAGSSPLPPGGTRVRVAATPS
jgi:hypothetical protein